MAQQQQKNRVKSPQKPMVVLPPRPFAPPFQKPIFNNKQKSFSTAFRTQSKGGGGK